MEFCFVLIEVRDGSVVIRTLRDFFQVLIFDIGRQLLVTHILSFFKV